MSDTLQKMRHTQLGYRTESFSGSGVRDLHRVLKYELSVLRNSDIIIYCNDYYLAGFGSYSPDDFSRVLATHADYYVRQIEWLVRRRLRAKGRLYGLWLTTKDNVHRIYGGVEEEITCYTIPKNAFVLSDLGAEGTLFVYQKHPRVYIKAQPQNKKAGWFCSLWQWFKQHRL